MKLKIDFITNSSSANLLLYIESTASTEEDFRKDMKKFVKDFFNERGWWYEAKDKEMEEKYKKFMEEAKDEKTKKMYKDTLDTWKYGKSRSQRVEAEIMQAKQIATHVFEIESWTSMLNYLPEDLPDYMKHLIMLYVTGDAIKYGIKRLTLRIDSDN